MNAQPIFTSPREQLLASMPVQERRLKLSGILTSVLEAGEGPPVVLLHGPLANATHWMGVIPALMHRYHVIVPDLPGHGASGAPALLNTENTLAWLGALIERTCATPPALVGQLMGGAIALRFAIEHSGRIERLMLVNTFGLAPLAPEPEFDQALARFQAQPSRSTHDGLWQHCAFDLPRLRARLGALWEPFAAYNIERGSTASAQAAFGALMAEFGMLAIPEAELRGITAPTSLIWGRHDRATPLAVAQAAAKRHGWPLEIIEDANDDPPVEQPEAVARTLLALLQRWERVPTPG